MTENLLLPFNGQLNLRNAYDWDRDQVSFSSQAFAFTKTAANN